MANSTTTFRADISQLKAAMQQAQRQVRLANSEFKAATAGLEDWSSSAVGLQAKIKQLDTTLKSQQRQVELARQEWEKTTKEYGENSAEADRARIRLNNYEAAVAKTESQLNNYEAELKDCENGTGRFSKELDTADKSARKASDGFTVMKGALASLVADGIRAAINGVKELATSTLQAGVSFDKSMSQVQAVSGATGDELDDLRDKAKEMGSTTAFTASEAADAMNYMAMAGWKTEDMLNGIDGVMNLAAASGEDLATTSDIVTDALTAMGYKAGDAGQLADVMAAASSNANTNVAMMGQTFQYAAPIIGSLGYSMEDTAVAIGLMANAGIKGEKAGTALRSTLSRLSAPPKACAEAMQTLGISMTDSEGKMKSFNEIMGDLRKSFSGLSETQQTQYAKAIAGQQAMSGLLAIVNAAPEDFDKLTKAVENSNGAAKDMADTMLDNLGGDITLLKSAFEGLQLEIFEGANAPLRALVQTITNDVIPSFTDLINNVDGAGEKFGASISTLLMQAINDAGNSLPTFVEIGASIVSNLILGLVKSFPTLVTKIGEGITTLLSTLTSSIPQILKALPSFIQQVIAALTQQLPLIIQGLMTLMQAIANNLPTIAKSLISALPTMIKQIVNALVSSSSMLVQGVVNLFNSLIPEWPGIITSLVDALLDQIDVVIDGAIQLFNGIVKAIPTIIVNIVRVLPQLITAIVQALISAIPQLLDGAIQLLMAIVNAIPVIIPEIVSALPDIIDTICNFLIDNMPLLIDASIQLFMAIVKAIPKILPPLVKAIPKIALSIIGALVKMIPKILSTALQLYMQIVKAIPKVIPKLIAKIPTIVSTIVKGLKGALSSVYTVGKNLIEGLWNGISDMAKWIKTKIQGFGKTVLNTLKDFFGIHSPSTLMRDEVGKWIAKGIVAGVLKEETNTIKSLKASAKKVTNAYANAFVTGMASSGRTLSNTAAKIVNNAYKTMLEAAKDFNFDAAADTASDSFSGALSKQAEYLIDKITYQNEARLSAWDATIDKYQKSMDLKVSAIETQRDKDIKAVEKSRDKTVAKLEKARDKKVAALEKKRDAAKTQAEKKKINKEIEATKKSYNNKIEAEKKQATKEINLIKSNTTKTIDAIKKKYSALIDEEEASRDSYQKASSEFLSEFTEAMNEYQTKAEDLINSTIDGITETYQAKYDALIDKQDSLIDKLKSAGDLFEVSGAGVMTISDIKAQTQNIKDYTSKLQQIKNKVSSDLFDQIAELDMKEGSAFIDQLLALPEEELQAYSDAFDEKMNVAEDLAESIYQSDFDKVADEYEDALDEAFKGLPDKLKELGNDVLEGFVKGMVGDTDYMTGEVKTMIDSMVNTFKKQLGIHSPSKVLMKLGEFSGEGFGNGLKNMVGYVRKTASSLIDATSSSLTGVKTSIGAAKSSINSGASGSAITNVTNNYNLVQNNNSPKSLSALETYQARRQQIAMVKALT